MRVDFTFRKAVAEDAPELARLLRSLNYFSRLESESLEVTLARVTRQMALALADSSHQIYVAESTALQTIVGYVAVHWLPYLFLEGPEGFVSELFIHDSARGQGIGAQLLNLVKTDAKARGCARLSLLNMRSRESYQRGFYTKQGWEERPDAANFIFQLNG